MAQPTALIAVNVADDAEAWSTAGFTVSPSSSSSSTTCSIRIGTADFVLLGSSARKPDEYPVQSWLFYRKGDPVDGEIHHDIDGLDIRTTGRLPTKPSGSTAPTHENKVTTIDHIVIQSIDVRKTVAEFRAKLGMEPRRLGGVGPMRKGLLFAFYKFAEDGCVIEIVGPDGTDPNVKPASPKTRLWGTTFNVSDMKASHATLDKRGAAKRLIAAVQGGRSIYTLDNKKIGVGMDMAFISKDGPKKGGKDGKAKM